jgi:hypothetical protein
LAKGKLLPEDIAPDIGPFSFYLQAFQELSTCRTSGFGLSPIPFTAIVDYSKIYEVEDFNEFLYFIRLMDNKFLDLENKKQSKPNGTNPSKKNRS